MEEDQTLVGKSRSGVNRIRLLMADPDECLQYKYREPLAQYGFDVISAFNGLDCLTQLRRWQPDLLLLEPELPWGGGDGVLETMGEDSQLATIPVIVLTSCRDPKVLQRVARFPIGSYQLKPLEPSRLALRMRRLLDFPRSRFVLTEQIGRLERSIANRTEGSIRDLKVDVVRGRVVVSGACDSLDAKQLVRTAVLDAFADSESQSDRIDLEINVG